ncbi:MAG: hypothetical protein IPM59_07495 [Chloracidobacterium sp.]|nr:hypothetical protein [Chloracidobacterium sp.]
MRGLTDRERIAEFMRAIGNAARKPVRVYFTGGVTAVLHGWRESTIDIDLRFVPEADELFRAVSEQKERLQVNVELAAPPDFIPEVDGWEDRSIFIAREGKVDFYHFDPYSQALSKLQRRHEKDVDDVRAMFEARLVVVDGLLEFFDRIKPSLYLYPAIDPVAFENSVVETVLERKQKEAST